MEQIVLKGSILGEKESEFTEQEKHLIHQITMAIRGRTGKYDVREDMELFARAGASVYELARKLFTAAQYSRFPATRDRKLDEWVRAIVGVRTDFMGDSLPTVDISPHADRERGGELVVDISPRAERELVVDIAPQPEDGNEKAVLENVSGGVDAAKADVKTDGEDR